MRYAVPSDFRKRVLAGDVVTGCFANLGSPLTAEIMGLAGFDWVVIDLEHGAGDEVVALGQLQALAATGTTGIVRVEGVNRPRFGRVLDKGAGGVLVPRVESTEEAALAAAYCRYSGERGVARQIRAWQFGLSTRELSTADDEVVCAVQIETRSALECVTEIAAVEGVDVLFVGPTDLGHALGITGGPVARELLEHAGKVAEAARASGKAAGVFVPTVEQAARYRELGFTFLGCATDGGMLADAAQAVAAGLDGLR